MSGSIRCRDTGRYFSGVWAGMIVLASMVVVVLAQGGTTVPNLNPSFTRGSDLFVLEDSGNYQAVWATNISDGDGGGQSLRFTLTPSNGLLFKSGATPSMTDKGALSFTPATDACDSTSIDVVLQDDGTSTCIESPPKIAVGACPGACQPLDCSKSSTARFTITIGCVNDCPSFQGAGDRSVDEGSGKTTAASFFSNVKTGPTNEASQKLTWYFNNDNNALFDIQPTAVYTQGSGSADLTFTVAANRYGTAKVNVWMKDDGGTNSGGCDSSSSITFSINVIQKNDPPTYTASTSTIQVNEDYGPYSYPTWARSISSGINENGQTTSFVVQFVDNSNTANFKTQPYIDSSGAFRFETIPNFNTYGKTIYVYVQLNDDGGGTLTPASSCSPISSCPQVQIVITPVNDQPSFTPGSNVEVWEDLLQNGVQSGALQHFVNNWAKDVTPGNTFEVNEGQTVTFSVSVDRTTPFATNPAIDSKGALSFTLNADKNGAVSTTAVISDNQAANNVGNTATFLINILPVNDAPLFTFSKNSGAITVLEDSSGYLDTSFINNIAPGPATATDEASQNLYFSTVLTGGSLFSTAPLVSFTTKDAAQISFVPAANMYGTATVTLTLSDDGGTERSGVDRVAKSFTITVTGVNDPPTFTITEDPLTVREDQFVGGFSRTGFITSMSAGPGGEDKDQTIATRTTNTASELFTSQPRIDASGTLTFTAASNAFGTSVVSFTLTDSGSPALSTTQTFSIVILPVNDAPSFTKGMDLTSSTLSECRTSTPCAYSYSQWATSISAGDSRESGQTLTFTIGIDSSISNLFADYPAINPQSGTLTFSLKPFQNTPSIQTLTITLRDDGGTLNGGVDSFTATMRLEVPAFVAAPSFTLPQSTVTCNENGGLQTFTNFLTNVAPGTAETGVANLRVSVSGLDLTLFQSTPTVVFATTTSVTLSFTPATDKSGSTDGIVTVAHLNTGKSTNSPFKIVINFINNAPTFTLVGDVVVRQGSGSYSKSVIASSSAGPGETSQTLSYTLNCDNGPLFRSLPSIDSSGVLSFVLTDFGLGTSRCSIFVQDNGGTDRGGQDTSDIKVFFIRVGKVNRAPSFIIGFDVTVQEDAAAVRIGSWATQISQGQLEDTVQQLTFTVTCTPVSLFSSQPAVDASGALTFIVAPDENGAATCGIYLEDNGPGDAPDANRSATQSFRVVVAAVNDPPSFALGSNIVVMENSGPYVATGWATAIRPGPANEASQTVSFDLTSTSSNVFTAVPTLSANGTLSFIPAAFAFGLVSVSCCAKDSLGATFCRTFSISIVAVNQPPSFSLVNYTIVQPEDAGSVRIPNLFAQVSAGPDNENDRIVSTSIQFLDSACNALFAVPPSISVSGTLGFQTTADAFGECNINITLFDSGNLGATVTAKIVIISVNDAPTYTAGPDVTSFQGLPVRQAGWLKDISPGPKNEASQTLTATVTTSDPTLFVFLPTIDVASGTLSFTLDKSVLGPVQFSYTLKDNGGTANGGVDTSVVGYANIFVTPVNAQPSFDFNGALTPVFCLEDSGSNVLPSFALRISAGAKNEDGLQQLTFKVSSNATELFQVQPTINNVTGALSFVTMPQRFGVALVDVILQDSGGTANGGNDTSARRSFTITIFPVNDPPFFVMNPVILTMLEDQTVTFPRVLSGLTAGPFEDATQSVTITALTAQGLPFGPSSGVASFTIDTTSGNVTVVPQSKFFGKWTVLVRATDDGGTENGGKNAYDVFVDVNVLPVNNPPTFSLPSAQALQFQQGANVTTVQSFVSDVRPGPDNEATQKVTLSVTASNPSLFLPPGPLLQSDGSLTFALDPSTFGTTNLTVFAVDNGGTTNGGVDSSSKSVLFAVARVNRPPEVNTSFSFLTVATGSSISKPFVTGAIDPDALTPEGRTGVVFRVTSIVNPSLFSGAVTVRSTDGTLNFVAGANPGTTLVYIRAFDSEGLGADPIPVEVTLFVAPRVVLTLNMLVSEFSVTAFQERTAPLFAVTPPRVTVTSVKSGSVIVEFYIAGEVPDVTPEDFVQRSTNLADPMYQALPIVSASLIQSTFAPSPPSSGSPSGPTTQVPGGAAQKDGTLSTTNIIIIVVASVLFILLIVGLSVCIWYMLGNSDRKKEEAKHGSKLPSDSPVSQDETVSADNSMKGADTTGPMKNPGTQFDVSLKDGAGNGVRNGGSTMQRRTNPRKTLPSYDTDPYPTDRSLHFEADLDADTSARTGNGIPRPGLGAQASIHSTPMPFVRARADTVNPLHSMALSGGRSGIQTPAIYSDGFMTTSRRSNLPPTALRYQQPSEYNDEQYLDLDIDLDVSNSMDHPSGHAHRGGYSYTAVTPQPPSVGVRSSGITPVNPVRTAVSTERISLQAPSMSVQQRRPNWAYSQPQPQPLQRPAVNDSAFNRASITVWDDVEEVSEDLSVPTPALRRTQTIGGQPSLGGTRIGASVGVDAGYSGAGPSATVGVRGRLNLEDDGLNAEAEWI